MHRSFTPFALAGIIFTGAAPLAAAPCQTLPSPVYVSGSSLLLPLLRAMSSALAAFPTPITVVYQASTSCAAVSAFSALQSPLLNGTGQIWNALGVQSTCDLEPGAATDVGISDLFPATCGSGDLASNVSEQLGPVDALAFVVPKSAPAVSISRGAAYMVFGFGAQSGPLIRPWNTPGSILHLGAASSTQLILGLGIGVPGVRWRPSSNALSNPSAMLGAIAAPSGSPGATIGILTSALADTQRNQLKVLAYREPGQSCAYFPDSTNSTTDRQNVRNGHYPLWGRSHFFYRSSIEGTPISANVAIVLGLISGTTSVGELNVVKLEASAGLVPDCAMRVTRSAEMGPLDSYLPESSCSCYYETVTAGMTTCTACTTSGECSSATPACNFGFCELQ